MAFERIGGLPNRPTRSLRCGIAAAAVVLVASVFGASFASASPLEEATHAVPLDEAADAVETVTAAPMPSLPDVAPPMTPSAPVETPAVPRVPASHLPVEVPTGATPKSSPTSHPAPTSLRSLTTVSSPGAELPSLREATGPAKESVGMVANTSTEAMAQRAAASVRNDAGVGSDRQRARPSVESARAAPLPRWLTYVWPAIMLGNTGTLGVLLARWETGSSLPLTLLPVSDSVRLLSHLMGITDGSDASTPSKQSATPIGSLPAPPVAPLPASGGMSLFLTIITSLLALVGLISLARLTVGEEFFSFLRWPH